MNNYMPTNYITQMKWTDSQEMQTTKIDLRVNKI